MASSTTKNHYTSFGMRRLLGAKREDIASLFGISLRSVARTESGTGQTTKMARPMYRMLYQSVKEAENRIAKKGAREILPDNNELLGLNAWYYQQVALLIVLREQLNVMQRRFHETAKAIEVVNNLEWPTDNPKERDRIEKWRRTLLARARLKNGRSGFKEQFKLEIRIAAAEAEKEKVVQLLKKYGQEIE